MIPKRKWTLEQLHHLDVDKVPLDHLRDALVHAERELEELRAHGCAAGMEREAARLAEALRRREGRLVG